MDKKFKNKVVLSVASLLMVVFAITVIYISKQASSNDISFEKLLDLNNTQEYSTIEETAEELSQSSTDLNTSENNSSTDQSDSFGVEAAAGKEVVDSEKNTTGNNKTPETKEEILDFYKSAVKRVTDNGAVGYKRIKWQELDSFDTQNKQANSIFKTFAEFYLTSEEEAKEECYSKYSQESKLNFPACSMTDTSFIQIAQCVADGNNYNIKIVIIDEKNPRKDNNHLGQITNEFLYLDDVYEVLSGIKMIKSIDESKTSLVYDDFTIDCTITSGGEFVKMSHYSTVNITASAIVEFGKEYPLNVTSQFHNYAKYYDFEY